MVTVRYRPSMQDLARGGRGPLGAAGSTLVATVALIGAALSSGACVERVEYRAPPEFELAMPRETMLVRQDEWLTIPVEVSRGEGHREAIALDVQALPLGFTVMPAEIAAGESSGVVQIRADDAPVGEELAVVVRGRTGDVTSSAAGTLLVMGRVSEYHSGALLELEQCSVVVKQGLPGGGLMFVSPTSMQILRVGATGVPMRSFGGGDGRASYAAALGSFTPTLSYPETAVQRDGKVLVAVGYDDPATEVLEDGTVLFRVLADGALDLSYGVGGRVLLPPRVSQIALSPGGDVAVLVAGAPGGDELTQLSGAGVPLRARNPGFSLSSLVVEPEGGVVAIAGDELVRLHADLSRDWSFGTDGAILLGSYTPLFTPLSDGYLVGGAVPIDDVLGRPFLEGRLWRFDRQWGFAPGYTARGRTLGINRLQDAPMAAFEDDGEIFTVVAGLEREDLVGNRRDGSVNEELGARWGTPGFVRLAPRFWGEYVVALVPHPPRRALAVRMYDRVDKVLFQATGVWY